VERILFNAEEAHREEIRQRTIDIANMVARGDFDHDVENEDDEIIAPEILMDMNSSEEEDLHAHMNNGQPMELVQTLGPDGNYRLALVVAGISP
jgi:hypothetical protein